jgi:uncharacterized membrane protein YbhN (UPF0104 family)
MRIPKFAKILVSLLLVGIVLGKTDLSIVIDALGNVDVNLYGAALLIMTANSVLLAMKYAFLMKPTGFGQSLGQLVRINFVCRFYSLFVHTIFGQGVVRWYMVTRDQSAPQRFLGVLLFERLGFLSVVSAAVLLGSRLAPVPGGNAMIATSGLIAAVLCLTSLLGLFLITLPAFGDLADRQLPPGATQPVNSRWSVLVDTLQSLCLFQNRYDLLVMNLLFSLFWHLLFLSRVLVLATAAGFGLDWMTIFCIASLVLFLQSIPVSLSGIGVREAAYAFLFSLYGLPPEKGVLLGVLLFSQILIMALIGGLLQLTGQATRTDSFHHHR